MPDLNPLDPSVEPNAANHSPSETPPLRDSNRITIGESANAKQVAAGTNITQIYNEADAAYDVHECENPYLGLAAFTYADRAKYAGREKLVAETVARITAPAAPIPLLFVTGASGSGKSSFAQAGLLPALAAFYSEFTVKRAVMRPAGDPFAALNDALWRQLGLALIPGVSANAAGLVPGGLFQDTPVRQINLLVLDQFEEFFTQSPQAARLVFFAWLAQLPPFAQTRTHIIATMRADYLPELFNYPALYDIAKGGVDLRAMNAAELEQAIQQPLRASPYRDTKRFEPSLVQVLAEDACKDAAYLPLLQVTLQEIWRKGRLKREAYTNLTDAIKQRADLVLRFKDFDAANPTVGRTEAEQTALLNLLLDLVDVSADDDTHRDVRKQRAKVELTGGDPTREQWVKQLSDARLLSVQQDAQDGNRTEVDLIHESLLTNWTRLQSEIAKRRADLRRRARFEQNLDEWLTEKRSEKYLLEGVRLAEARELEASDDVALRSDDAKAYLRASVARVEAEQQAELEKERKQIRTLRSAVVGLGVLSLLALLAGAAALFFLTQSNANLQLANDQARISDSRALAAQSISKRADNLGLAYLLGIEGYKTSPTFEAQSNLFALRFADLYQKRFLWGHQNFVTSESFSPDGKLLASGGCQDLNRETCTAGEILLWDVEALKRIGEFPGHSASVSKLVFSPNGKKLASVSCTKRGSMRSCQEGELFLWDVGTQQRIVGWKGQAIGVWDMQFSPDSTLLATWSCEERDARSSCTGRTISLWDIEKQKFLGELEPQAESVYSMAFSADSRTIAAGSCQKRDDIGYCKAGRIYLWDIETRKKIGELYGHPTEVSSVIFSGDGKLLVSASAGTIMVWDTKTWKSFGEASADLGGPLKMVLSSDSGTLVMWNEGNIQWWDVSALLDPAGGKDPMIDIKEVNASLLSVIFKPDGNILATDAMDNMIRVWDFASQDYIPITGAPLSSLGFSPDSRILASGDLNGTVWFWDVGTMSAVGEPLTSDTYPVPSLEFSPDGNLLATGSQDGTIRLWDVPTRRLLTQLRNQKAIIWSIAFSWDGKTLASASGYGTIALWDVEAVLNPSITVKEPVGVLQGHEADVVTVAFSRDNRTLASGSFDDTVKLWDVGETRLLGTLSQHTDDISDVIFSPDEKTLASGSSDYTIRFWDMKTWEQIGQLQGFGSDLSYDADGKMLVSGGMDQKIKLWDIERSQLIGELQLPTFDTRALLSPDGKEVAAWSEWGATIHVLDMEPQAWIDRACQVVNRNLTRAEYAQFISREPSAYDTKYAKNPTCPGMPIEPIPMPTPSPTP